VDTYCPELWAWAEAYFRGLEGDQRFPGGRYACAQALIERRLPFLEGMALGEVCHIVQLGLSQRHVLGYLDGSIVPFHHSEDYIKQQCAARGEPVNFGRFGRKVSSELRVATWQNIRECILDIFNTQLMRGHAGVITLSNVKRLFRFNYNLELSETALGHARLHDVLQDERLGQLCAVRCLDGRQVLVHCEDGTRPDATRSVDATRRDAHIRVSASSAATTWQTVPTARTPNYATPVVRVSNYSMPVVTPNYSTPVVPPASPQFQYLSSASSSIQEAMRFHTSPLAPAQHQSVPQPTWQQVHEAWRHEPAAPIMERSPDQSRWKSAAAWHQGSWQQPPPQPQTRDAARAFGQLPWDHDSRIALCGAPAETHSPSPNYHTLPQRHTSAPLPEFADSAAPWEPPTAPPAMLAPDLQEDCGVPPPWNAEAPAQASTCDEGSAGISDILEQDSDPDAACAAFDLSMNKEAWPPTEDAVPPVRFTSVVALWSV